LKYKYPDISVILIVKFIDIRANPSPEQSVLQHSWVCGI